MRVALAVVALAGVGFLSSQAPAASAFDGPIREARLLHDRGADGDKEAVIRCITLLEGLLAKDPANFLAKVYLGSALTLRARDLPIGPNKLKTLKEGGRVMDEAVAAAPSDLRVRMVRAANSVNLPALFGRRGVAREDLGLLVAAIDGGRHDLSPEEQQAAFYFAGKLAKAEGDRGRARQLWERALNLAPRSALSAEILHALGR